MQLQHLYEAPTWIPTLQFSSRSEDRPDLEISMIDFLGHDADLGESPYRSLVESKTEALFLEFDLPAVRDYHRRAQVGGLTSLGYPDADAESAFLIHVIMLTFFMIDDELDNRKRHVDELAELYARWRRAFMGLAERQADSRDPYVKLLRFIRARIRDASPGPFWRQRMELGILHFLRQATSAARRWREGRDAVHWEVYCVERFQDIGVNPILDLLELGNGCVLGEKDWSRDEFQHLRSAVSFHVTLVNDLFSYKKEVEQRSNLNNAVAILQHQFGIDALTAQSAMIRMTNECFLKFDEARIQQLRGTCDEALAKHIGDMKNWMVAALQWHSRSGRYAHEPSKEASTGRRNGPLSVSSALDPTKGTERCRGGQSTLLTRG